MPASAGRVLLCGIFSIFSSLLISFEYSLSKPVLSTNRVPGPVVGLGDSAIERTAWAFALMRVAAGRADGWLATRRSRNMIAADRGEERGQSRHVRLRKAPWARPGVARSHEDSGPSVAWQDLIIPGPDLLVGETGIRGPKVRE